ncbi:rho GTPase-activating protein 45-like [Convolutriloba macropyga]|uniref:rho GTPase-activating protein 45-like n=1 Tax=Convolutriloba macropyga TaxID=536237 RepID=UPI003F526408
MPVTPVNGGNNSGSGQGTKQHSHIASAIAVAPVSTMFEASTSSVATNGDDNSETNLSTNGDKSNEGPYASCEDFPGEEGGDGGGEGTEGEGGGGVLAFFGSDEVREGCIDHLKKVTAAHDAWEEALKDMAREEGASIAFLNLSSAMKAFHTEIMHAIREQDFFRCLESEANRVEEQMILYNKSVDTNNTQDIAKAIELMFKHFVNKCSSGSTYAVSEGGDKELLRHGDLGMKKLFEHTKAMRQAMIEILQMIEGRIKVEMEFATTVNKMALHQKNALKHMSQTFPFVDILDNLATNEHDYSLNMLTMVDRLTKKEFIDPLKARISDFDDVTQELKREWSRKQANYEKAKDNSKEAYNKYYNACVEYERLLTRGSAVENARLHEKQYDRNKKQDEFNTARKDQTKAYGELCEKRQWVLTSTLNVVWQAERKLQSALTHFFRNFATGLQQRPLIYKYLLSETVAKTLTHNENMVYDILYQDPDIQISSKDQELEFEKRENPYEKELTPQEAVAQKGSKEGSSISGNFLGNLGFFKMQHTWEKLSPDDTEESRANKCGECKEYVYEGCFCSRCQMVIHLEHKDCLRNTLCDPNTFRTSPDTIKLKYFRRAVADQPKGDFGEPKFLQHMLGIMEERFIKDIGIYRQEGVRKKAALLCEKIENDIDSVKSADISDHKVLGMVIKHYFRTIPKSLLEEKLFDSWMTLGADIVKSTHEGNPIPPHVLPGIHYNLQSIGEANRRATKILMLHLTKVVSFSANNNMNSHNLGVVFGPNLIRKTKSETVVSSSSFQITAEASKDHTDLLKTVMAYMIDNYEQVFENEAFTSSFSKSTASSSIASNTLPESNRASHVSSEGGNGQYVELDPLQVTTLAALKRASDLSSEMHSASSTEHFPPIDDSPSTSRSRTPAPAPDDQSTPSSSRQQHQQYTLLQSAQKSAQMSKTSSNYELS